MDVPYLDDLNPVVRERYPPLFAQYSVLVKESNKKKVINIELYYLQKFITFFHQYHFSHSIRINNGFQYGAGERVKWFFFQW